MEGVYRGGRRGDERFWLEYSEDYGPRSLGTLESDRFAVAVMIWHALGARDTSIEERVFRRVRPLMLGLCFELSRNGLLSHIRAVREELGERIDPPSMAAPAAGRRTARGRRQTLLAKDDPMLLEEDEPEEEPAERPDPPKRGNGWY